MKVFPFLLLFTLLAAPLPSTAITPPDAIEAFGVFTSKGAGGSVNVHFDVKPGFAIYRDRISLEAVGGRISSLTIPHGRVHTDPYVGQTEHLSGFVTLGMTIQAVDHSKPVMLQLRFMGCMVDEFCYPPQRLEFDLGKM